MKLPLLALACLLAVPPSLAGDLPRSPSPPGAELYFIAPGDGETLSGPFTVRFGLRGMGVAPAGVQMDETGHHHLLINVENLDVTRPIPADDRHLHFGRGQTEAVIELPTGRHTLQLVLGDHLHMPHDPPVVSERITIVVE